eukprot:TRINITY_DN6438_c0_g1_i1.p1 TRINITY_DN6438_c0_g1~~TRINITY_DN6438_c0_g1_i1.p1  ORF type:complete len:802 (+),score=67.25 TRINITY_DN6438_c0_g1_i1:62-2467(+)
MTDEFPQVSWDHLDALVPLLPAVRDGTLPEKQARSVVEALGLTWGPGCTVEEMLSIVWYLLINTDPVGSFIDEYEFSGPAGKQLVAQLKASLRNAIEGDDRKHPIMSGRKEGGKLSMLSQSNARPTKEDGLSREQNLSDYKISNADLLKIQLQNQRRGTYKLPPQTMFSTNSFVGESTVEPERYFIRASENYGRHETMALPGATSSTNLTNEQLSGNHEKRKREAHEIGDPSVWCPGTPCKKGKISMDVECHRVEIPEFHPNHLHEKTLSFHLPDTGLHSRGGLQELLDEVERQDRLELDNVAMKIQLEQLRSRNEEFNHAIAMSKQSQFLSEGNESDELSREYYKGAIARLSEAHPQLEHWRHDVDTGVVRARSFLSPKVNCQSLVKIATAETPDTNSIKFIPSSCSEQPPASRFPTIHRPNSAHPSPQLPSTNLSPNVVSHVTPFATRDTNLQEIVLALNHLEGRPEIPENLRPTDFAPSQQKGYIPQHQNRAAQLSLTGPGPPPHIGPPLHPLYQMRGLQPTKAAPLQDQYRQNDTDYGFRRDRPLPARAPVKEKAAPVVVDLTAVDDTPPEAVYKTTHAPPKGINYSPQESLRNSRSNNPPFPPGEHPNDLHPRYKTYDGLAPPNLLHNSELLLHRDYLEFSNPRLHREGLPIRSIPDGRVRELQAFLPTGYLPPNAGRPHLPYPDYRDEMRLGNHFDRVPPGLGNPPLGVVPPHLRFAREPERFVDPLKNTELERRRFQLGTARQGELLAQAREEIFREEALRERGALLHERQARGAMLDRYGYGQDRVNYKHPRM